MPQREHAAAEAVAGCARRYGDALRAGDRAAVAEALRSPKLFRAGSGSMCATLIVATIKRIMMDAPKEDRDVVRYAYGTLLLAAADALEAVQQPPTPFYLED